MKYEVLIYAGSKILTALDVDKKQYISMQGNTEHPADDINGFYENLLDFYNVDDLSEIKAGIRIINGGISRNNVVFLNEKFKNVEDYSIWRVEELLPIVVLDKSTIERNVTLKIRVYDRCYIISSDEDFNINVSSNITAEKIDNSFTLDDLTLLNNFNGLRLYSDSNKLTSLVNELNITKSKEEEKNRLFNSTLRLYEEKKNEVLSIKSKINLLEIENMSLQQSNNEFQTVINNLKKEYEDICFTYRKTIDEINQENSRLKEKLENIKCILDYDDDDDCGCGYDDEDFSCEDESDSDDLEEGKDIDELLDEEDAAGESMTMIHETENEKFQQKLNSVLTEDNYSVGNIIEFGRYNGKPIQWRILNQNNDSVYVLCEEILCENVFSESDSNVWANSNLRKWLNGEFYTNAFNDEEKSQIISTEGDKITLLTREEAESLLSKEDRAAGSWWWLRSPNSSHSSLVRCVCDDGDIFCDNANNVGGVRPALYLSVDNCLGKDSKYYEII